ncbi:MAG TPA: ABC transporter substrate-binding protein [Bacteroidales bacterium]|nr:ABC transporter substrate-binding protein [Bacteroidales bacterium]
MYRRLLPVILIVLLATGCHNSARVSKSYTMATLKGPSSMGMIRLIDSLQTTKGASVSVMILNEPMQVRKMMLDGTADFAILPTTMAALVYNKGLQYKMLGVPDWGSLFLFGSDTTVKEWNDLRGKRIYLMAKGMTPDVLFRYLLSKNGIDPEKDVILDYSFPTHIDLANAVAAGQAPLGVISEPMSSLAMAKNKAVKPIIDLNLEWEKSEGSKMALTAFMATKDLVKKDKAIVEKIVSSYRYSAKWVNREPDSAAALIVKYGILPDKEIAIVSIPRSSLEYVSAKDAEKQIKEFLEVFYSMNPEIIGGKMPDEDFWY